MNTINPASGMLPDALVPHAKEWYSLCERRFAVDSINISGALAEAIVEAVCASGTEQPTSERQGRAVTDADVDLYEAIRQNAIRTWEKETSELVTMNRQKACRVGMRAVLEAQSASAAMDHYDPNELLRALMGMVKGLEMHGVVIHADDKVLLDRINEHLAAAPDRSQSGGGA